MLWLVKEVKLKKSVRVKATLQLYTVTLDIDECSMQVDDCEHNCNNTLGSYTCSCSDGYILDRDGIQCNGKKVCHVAVILQFESINLLSCVRY